VEFHNFWDSLGTQPCVYTACNYMPNMGPVVRELKGVEEKWQLHGGGNEGDD
jgi:hypothetical protein